MQYRQNTFTADPTVCSKENIFRRQDRFFELQNTNRVYQILVPQLKREIKENYHRAAKVVDFRRDFRQSWYSRWSDLWSWFLLCSNRGHLVPLIFRCSVGITHPQHLLPGPYGQKFLPKINAFSSFCPTWEKCSLLPVEISDDNNGKIFEKFRLRRCVLHLQTLAKLKNSWFWFRMKTSCRG